MFTYEPLESPERQIRLLRFLHAGPSDADEISVELSTWYDDKAPEYKAISYTWGDPRDVCSIRGNEQCFILRRNCHYALWQTWSHWPECYIWIDSLCIDQASVSEKGFQVQRMATIYANAETVLICVGPHSDGSEALVAYAEELRVIRARLISGDAMCDDVEDNDLEEDDLEDGEIEDGEIEDDEIEDDEIEDDEIEDDELEDDEIDNYEIADNFLPAWHSLKGEEYVDKAREIIRAFVFRTYWSRVWIVQEVAVAKSKIILCGDHRLHWHAMNLFYHVTDRDSFPHHFLAVTTATPGGFSLLEAIEFFNDFHCTDVRDRLYGILGLIEWENEHMEKPTVDYNVDAFELLLRTISGQDHYADFVFDAIELFEVDSRTKQIQDLTQRVAYGSLGKGDAVFREHKTSQETQVIRADMERCQIYENGAGQLVASFSRDPPANIPFPRMISNFSLYPWRDGGLPDFSRPIYSGTLVAALAFREVQKNDILVSHSFHRPDCLLVLRKIQGNDYDIVGQALSVNGFHITTDNLHRSSMLRVSLTPIEVLFLWTQDHQGFDEGGDSVYDPDAQLRRLRTPVVLAPGQCLRASLLPTSDSDL